MCGILTYVELVRSAGGDLKLELLAHSEGEGVVWSPKFSARLEDIVDFIGDQGVEGSVMVDADADVQQVIGPRVLPQVDREPARAHRHQILYNVGAHRKHGLNNYQANLITIRLNQSTLEAMFFVPIRRTHYVCFPSCFFVCLFVFASVYLMHEVMLVLKRHTFSEMS